tara:strand:+ start:11248 stop:14349 length:3102 start_codon:yes stop_codon:yes gene_type:complete
MKTIINFFIEKYKSTILIFLLIFITGLSSYFSIPKESQPNIEIPYIWVDVFLEGVSPEDSEKLIVRPLENELKNLQDLKEIKGEASESFGSVFLEFEAGTDTDAALANVRDAVTIAKAELPPSAEEPVIREFSMADERPVLTITVSGNVDQRSLDKVVNYIDEELSGISEVLNTDISGQRTEMIEITISPEKMQLYNISQSEVLNLFNNNDRLIPAGKLENFTQNIAFKISGAVDTLDEIKNMPIRVIDDQVLLFKDLATINRVYKTPSSFARINTENAIGISVKKRSGANILDTVEKSKNVVEKIKNEIPSSIHIKYTYDGSQEVNDLLEDLENNIISSVFLVFLVIVAALGFRTSVLVGLAIPSAFLMGILILQLSGISINMVVLFALIMSIGMLVDGAIVVSEYADKKMQEGLNKKEAFKEAAIRMSMPIISSTATTLAAFFPLLFWPGTTGQFMSYLPLTLIVTLTSSVFMALIFIPTLGSKFGRSYTHETAKENLKALRKGDYTKISGLERLYFPVLKYSVNNPKTTIFSIILLSIFIVVSYVGNNAGSLFFPEGNSDNMNVYIKDRGDYSIFEKDQLVRKVEKEIIEEFSNVTKTFYTRTVNSGDTIGRISLTFKDWQERPSSSIIANNVREHFMNTYGYTVEVRESRGGPTSGKELQLELSSNNKDNLYNSVEELTKKFKELGYITDIENDLPLSGMQWEFDIDRQLASQYGTSLSAIGSKIQFVTNGLKITEYNPDDLDEEIDVRIRFPNDQRTIETINNLMIETNKGQVPISTFVERKFTPKVTSITRIDGKETITLAGNIKEGYLLNNKLPEIESILKDVLNKNPNVSFKFAGDQEEQNNTMQFLMSAFGIAIFIMFMILVAQFNSYYQTFIVLSAIVFSTMGVLGLLYIMNEPFGIVMGGIGVISLAGIVINNNIVLIDTYNEKYNEYNDYYKAVIETGIERFRPVLLTTITTILGLVPMAFKLNINVFNGTILYDSPSSQFWYQLAYSIIGGMGFAFFITLIITPALLIVFKHHKENKNQH